MIDTVFTKEELDFIYEQHLNEDDFYDGRGEKKQQRHENARNNGCMFLIAGECQNGHRLKTRSGHCIQCDTSKISFQKRHSSKGAIYVAVCGDYCKVGVVDNNCDNAEYAIHQRALRLNLEGGYGGMTGWKIIAWAPVNEGVGKMEEKIHKKLLPYSIKQNYIWSGEKRVAQELFKCDSSDAIDLIDEEIVAKWTFE